MAYLITDQLVGGQLVSEAWPTPRHPLGTISHGADPTYGAAEFVYLQGATGTVVGSVVLYNADDYTTSLLGQNDIGPVAVAMAAVGPQQYGWYQVHGKAIVSAPAVVDNASVYSSATPGQVDDTVAAGDRVKGARFASASGVPSAGLAECEIARPWVDDGLPA